MHPKSPKLLEDNRDVASFVCESVRDMDGDTYKANRILRQAVERNFEIIGEALNRLSQLDEATTARVGPVGQIKAFRNILIHAYDNIDHDIVWDVIQNKLAPVLQNVEQLLIESQNEE